MKRPLLSLAFVIAFGAAALAQAAGATGRAALSNDIFMSHLQKLDWSAYAGLSYPHVLEASSALNASSSRKPAEDAGLPGEPATAAVKLQTPCAQPAKLFSADEYSGPLKRLAAWFSRRPEITTVPAHRKNGKTICGLSVGEKFHSFVSTTVDPVTFFVAGGNAGFAQWMNDDPSFGQGAKGLGKRYAAALADQATQNFFGEFFYPALFKQDPRYFRQGQGTVKSRVGHALAHTFVARRDSGRPTVNYSQWAATISSVGVGNLYHPGNEQGFGPAAGAVAISISTDAGLDVLTEFWPEIVRELHLPFRERQVVTVTTVGSKRTGLR